MKRITKFLAGALFCLVQSVAAAQNGHPAAAQGGDVRPSELVRAMAALQDRIVMGDAAAKGKLPLLISQISDKLFAVDAMVWADPRNDHAIVAYTLSGGQPRVIRKVLQTGAVPQAEANLMAGALAYAEGQEAKAREILTPIEATKLSPSVGGLVALAKAALFAKSDPRRAAHLLDEARLLAPGTLVEEAGLRRSAFLADEAMDFDRFISASSQYFRRYRNSLYANDFRRRFAESIVHFSLRDEPGQSARLAALLSELDRSYQAELYLIIAQTGIRNGKIGPAKAAAEKALSLSDEGGGARVRAQLYAATAKVLIVSPAEGFAELAKIDDAVLPRTDRDLKSAVLRLAAEIQKSADGAQAQDVSSRERAPASGAEAQDANGSILIQSAQAALRQTDALLKESAQ